MKLTSLRALVVAIDEGRLRSVEFGLRSIIAGRLLPYPIAVHPFALQHLEVVPVVEGPLRLTIGALARHEAALEPGVRHFLAHRHRAAHQLRRVGPP